MSYIHLGLPEVVVEKAPIIRAIITDIDGVFSTGSLFFDAGREELKQFHSRDGAIVPFLKKNGILVGAISSRYSKTTENLLDSLNFDFHYHGVKNKVQKLREVLDILEISWEEVLYIGDDLEDLPLFAEVGLSACPADAPIYIQEQVEYVCTKKGGDGSFREIADLLLDAKGLLRKVIEDAKNEQTYGKPHKRPFQP